MIIYLFSLTFEHPAVAVTVGAKASEAVAVEGATALEAAAVVAVRRLRNSRRGRHSANEFRTFIGRLALGTADRGL
jgi:hypothetical protein